jgi:hypothetical protein
MREFVISVAAMAMFGALLSAAPAKADFNFGPIKNGNQCWKYSTNSKEFGYWMACPEPAAVAAPAPRKSHHHAS